MKATIKEQGNGLPDVGDYCACTDGELYVVDKIVGRIQTGGSGSANYIHAEVSLASWDDCTEEDQHTALVLLDAVSDCPLHRDPSYCGRCNYCEESGNED